MTEPKIRGWKDFPYEPPTDPVFVTTGAFAITMSQVVGRNVMAAREARGWTRAEFRKRLADSPWWFKREDGYLDRVEEGTRRGVTVDEVVVFGLALGVSPLVLLAPPRLSRIANPDGDQVFDAEGFAVMGTVVTHGPWESGYDLDVLNEWETNLWSEASRDLVYVPQEMLDALGSKAEHDEEMRLLKKRLPLIRAYAELVLSPSDLERLDAAGGDWGAAGFEERARADNWSFEDLKKRVAEAKSRLRAADAKKKKYAAELERKLGNSREGD